MRLKKWTLLLVSEDGDEHRQFTFGKRELGRALGGAGFFCIGVFALTGLAGYFGSHSLRTYNLQQDKALLSRELETIQDRVHGLEEELRFLAEKDAELRILAGMETIDEEVLQVGVGGPGLSTPEDHPLSSVSEEIGEKAFAVAYDLNALERRSRLLRESMLEASDSLEAHRDLLESTPSILPTAGLLTSGFSNARRHPLHNRELPHEGVDISAPRGTPILAAAKGRVTFAGRRAGYGLVVEIDHGYGYSTLYGHASKTLVNVGQQVDRGAVIAHVGSTGIATSPHVHYEVRVGNRPVNPMNYVISGTVP